MTAHVSPGHRRAAFQAAVCKALDLDPARVVGLKLEMKPMEVRLVIEHLPTDEQLAVIADIVAKTEPRAIRSWRRDSRRAIAGYIAELALRARAREDD